ncbi:MAG: thioredoxin [Pseudomonadota bacterium]
MTQIVTDNDFHAVVISSDKPVLVDFYAEWCGPCKQMAPALDELAEEMADQVTIVKIDAEDSPEAPTRYGIRGFPTLLIFKNGEVAAKQMGAMRKSQLKQWIESAL